MVPDPSSNATDESRRYVTRYDSGGPSKLTTTLVHALAEFADTDVTEMEETLYDRVDPDALDQLFAPRSDGTPRSEGHVTFTLAGHLVMVTSDGRIEITPREAIDTG